MDGILDPLGFEENDKKAVMFSQPSNKYVVSVPKIALAVFVYWLFVSGAFGQIPNSGIPKTPSIKQGLTPKIEAMDGVGAFGDYKSIVEKIGEQKAKHKEIKDELHQLDSNVRDSSRHQQKLEQAKQRIESEIISEQERLLEELQSKSSGQFAQFESSIDLHSKSLSSISGDFEGLKSKEDLLRYLDVSEENLKFLANEHLFPILVDPLEAHLNPEMVAKMGKDFYTEGIPKLTSKAEAGDLVLSRVSLDRLKEGGMEEGLAAQPQVKEIVKKAGPVSQFASAKAELERAPLGSRVLVGAGYFPLQGLKEGLVGYVNFGFRANPWLTVTLGGVGGKTFPGNTKGQNEGFGMNAGVRLGFSKWFVGLHAERIRYADPTNNVPSETNQRQVATYPTIELGRTIPFSRSLSMVFSGFFDPLFEKEERLYSNAFGVKVGIEFNRLNEKQK